MAPTLPTLVRAMTQRLLVLVAGLATAACATPYAKVDGVLAGTRPAPAGGPARVTLIHQGESRAAVSQQSFVKGDSMLTAADGVALLTLRAGYEVIVEPGTELSIENPSIFVKVGRLIVKTIRRTSEALRLNTRFVSAGVEGTEFIFEVSRDSVVRVYVMEGIVSVSSRSGSWPGETFTAGQVATFRGAAPPARVQPLDPNTTRATRQRIQTIEQAAQYQTGQPWSRFTPLWKKPIFFVPAAAILAGAGFFVLKGGGAHQGTVTINIPF
jgi:ferric-dicitrate binding protein FerR (iron transport regulator)